MAASKVKSGRTLTFRADNVLDGGLDIAQIVKGSTASDYIRGALYDRMKSDGFIEYSGGGLSLASRFSKLVPRSTGSANSEPAHA